MKNVFLGAVAVLALATGVISWLVLGRVDLNICLSEAQRCVRGCDEARDSVLVPNEGRRDSIYRDMESELLECNDRFPEGSAARTECHDAVHAIFDPMLEVLERSDNAALDAHRTCVDACNRENLECGSSPARGPTIVDETFTLPPCAEGGPPCFRRVPEICTVISGPCDNCWTSLCGGGEWTFAPERGDLTVTLVAADGLTSKNRRVLATSTPRDKLAALSVPADIKLNPGERLYFGFSSKEKTAGPRNVTVRRSR